MADDHPSATYVTVASKERGVLGYTWRIWARSTSFYLKSRASELGLLKVSLHGDDPRHPCGGGFKVDLDETIFRESVAEGTVVAAAQPDTSRSGSAAFNCGSTHGV